jgi:hypothetical protein
MINTIRVCAYCNGTSQARLTKEHLLSNSVRKILHKNPRVFLPFQDHSHNSEPEIKDVCAICNNEKLSPMDVAGKELALRLKETNAAPDPLFLNKLQMLWLLKCTLNYVRMALRRQKLPVNNDPSIYEQLLKLEMPVPKNFRFYLLPYNAPKSLPFSWTVVSGGQILSEIGFCITSLRIRWLEAILVTPLDYRNYSEKIFLGLSRHVESLHRGIIPIWNLPDCEAVAIGTALAVSEYELSFSLKEFGPGFFALSRLMPPSSFESFHEFYEKHKAYPNFL